MHHPTGSTSATPDDTAEQDPDGDGDGYPASQDCDDNLAAVNPGMVESCDGLDNDCDGEVDEEEGVIWYRDVDGDGYGDPALNPETAWYADEDQDGYGDPDTLRIECEGSEGYVLEEGDCDDTNADLNPDTVWYTDLDGDGYGDEDKRTTRCEQPASSSAVAGDCDDYSSIAYPGADEYCDGVDTDCDGSLDEDDSLDAGTWYADADSDGFGDPATATVTCDQPSGYVADLTDCDDTDDEVYPGAVEVCDRVDNDCDSSNDPDILVPTDEASIQDALTNSTYGDWICVEAGTYYESDLDFPRAVTLTGEDRNSTVIDGSDDDANILDIDVDDVMVAELTLTNSNYAAVSVGSSATGVEFEDLLITEVHAEARSAGADLGNSTSTTWTRVDFIGNSATTGYPYGVALSSWSGSEVSLNQVRVLDNRGLSTDQCLGMLHFGSGPTVEMVNVLIAGNSCEETDGSTWAGSAGVFTHGGAEVYAENVTITGNHAGAGTGYVTAMGWYTYSGTDSIELVNVDISHNTADAASSGHKAGFFGASGATVDMSYSNAYGNDGVNWHSNHDPAGADGCLGSDPDYADTSDSDAEDWDLSLGASSDLVDGGDPSLYDADGSTSDIGALGGEGGESFYD